MGLVHEWCQPYSLVFNTILLAHSKAGYFTISNANPWIDYLFIQNPESNTEGTLPLAPEKLLKASSLHFHPQLFPVREFTFLNILLSARAQNLTMNFLKFLTGKNTMNSSKYDTTKDKLQATGKYKIMQKILAIFFLNLQLSPEKD